MRAPLRGSFNGAGGLGEVFSASYTLTKPSFWICAAVITLTGAGLDAGALDARAGDGDRVEILGGRTGGLLLAASGNRARTRAWDSR
jgi:hypothetical protein